MGLKRKAGAGQGWSGRPLGGRSGCAVQCTAVLSTTVQCDAEHYGAGGGSRRQEPLCGKRGRRWGQGQPERPGGMQSTTLQYSAVQCGAVQDCAEGEGWRGEAERQGIGYGPARPAGTWSRTRPCSAVQSSAVHYSAVQYSAVQWTHGTPQRSLALRRTPPRPTPSACNSCFSCSCNGR